MVTQSIPFVDFSGDSQAVLAVVEAERLIHGYLSNPFFGTEISLIDPLPHQRIAVYDFMLAQSRLRFLLADDAGAGKTIMTGLYIREMLMRGLLKRILIVPPAGLVGNWEREMRTLFNLRFKIVSGSDSKESNPFADGEDNLVIISIDTLAGERTWSRLKESQVQPYDLVVFDEAHKLSADRDLNFRVRKTERYKLGEALSGVIVEDTKWSLSWSARHLLLLTATPHMGKDLPYYYLWRLLEPQELSTKEAFDAYPQEMKKRHFIRRIKEEMVRFDGSRIYPDRTSDTLSYKLSSGPLGEQQLYDETTDYILTNYNKAKILNRSAARFAMGIFQRRLASSTLALLRSYERRLVKINDLIESIENGSISFEDLVKQQPTAKPVLEEKTGDEETTKDGLEENETVEDELMGGTASTSLPELKTERDQVSYLLEFTKSVYEQGEESKFERLRELIQSPKYGSEKIIVFTEYRDTLDFLVRRLEGIGYVGQVAKIHGGMNYEERDEQVEFFRKGLLDGGAKYLIATDAAGEGINLQFCWLMVNYDIPWNPARLEQRMGRIHRYGQDHDPVVILNLVSSGTREGRVMQTLLKKLEQIRRDLGSDMVFDVVGRLFEGVSLYEYIENALTEEGENRAIQQIDSSLTKEQVRAIEAKEKSLFGNENDSAKLLAAEKERHSLEAFRRLLPGYVRRFLEFVAPLIGFELIGDLNQTFSIEISNSNLSAALLPIIEIYPQEIRDKFTVNRPKDSKTAIYLRPGEPVFDKIAHLVLSKFSTEALKGGVFTDPQTEQPYFVHVHRISYNIKADILSLPMTTGGVIGDRVIAFKQIISHHTVECPVEQLLLLRGSSGVPPSSLNFVATIEQACKNAEHMAKEAANKLVAEYRKKSLDDLPENESFLLKGFDYQDAELSKLRSEYSEKVSAGHVEARVELSRIKERQKKIEELKTKSLEQLRKEAEIAPDCDISFIAHALVLPSNDPEDKKRYDKSVEAIAIAMALGYEDALGATVIDVSKPELARKAGMIDNPGFDLLSKRPNGEEIGIEVKGRANVGDVELHRNEWSQAINLGSKYWLYVVYDCATSFPRLLRVRDPFTNLYASPHGGVIIDESSIFSKAEK